MGRPIARKMAEKLGIEYYDRDLVDQAAEKLQLPSSKVDEQDETYSEGKINPFFRMASPLGKKQDMQQKIFEAQKNIIKFLAERESCIIVGRCSDFILSEMDNLVNIYIYAPYRDRLDHCINDLGMEEAEAKKLIVEVDEARKAYHQKFAGFDPDDRNHKDILVNSSLLGVDGTAEFLAGLVRQKFGV